MSKVEITFGTSNMIQYNFNMVFNTVNTNIFNTVNVTFSTLKKCMCYECYEFKLFKRYVSVTS